MKLDNKLATYPWTGTVTSLYRGLETKFLDHSSLDIVEDELRNTCINFGAFSKSVDYLGLTSSDVICESVEKWTRGTGNKEQSVDRQYIYELEDDENLGLC
ncbi:hypothetical protein K0M31_016444 [Melipona bicolor]|uniref:Uncharacterized protein n=1 Tax=Melipona bicolor TaxID=60889 RepID=A0AA40G773_9HYME|nr:hypothetical protein K0M31_016444 [Melipona bicolor]